MRIALDFDNVLADTIGSWIKSYNRLYNKCIKKADISEYQFWNILNISRDEAFRIFSLVWSNWKHLPMLEHNSASVVNEIGELSEIDIVTSVVSSSLANIEEWLNENEFNFNKIICASEKGALEYDIFIDDSPYVAMDVVRKDRICLLYDQPWNRNIEFSKLIRIKKLQEIVNIIQNISTGELQQK